MVMFCKELIFQSSLRFTATLSRKYREFPCTPCLHTSITCPTINILYQSNTFVTVDEPTCHHHLKFIVYTTVYPWCTLCGFEQMYNDVYSSLQYRTVYFHCPENPLSSACSFLLLLNPWQPLLFVVVVVVLNCLHSYH